MELRKITYNFEKISCYNIFKLKRRVKYKPSDYSYGEFFFYSSGFPLFYYNCINADGTDKTEIVDINDIYEYLIEIIFINTQKRVDKIDEKLNLGEICHEIGVEKIELYEIISLDL